MTPKAKDRHTGDPSAMVLDAKRFARIASIAKREAGLTIPKAKIAMVQSRLLRRLSATDLDNFDAYLSFVENADGSRELENMISALTTNVSHFFREQHHFETLRDQVLPDLIARARAGQSVRLWSAGCSSGQEPYSIAMTLLDAFPQASDFDIRILATDVDRAILARARAGEFDQRQMDNVSEDQRKRYFEVSSGDSEATWRPGPAIRALVSFRHLNLIRDWPMKMQFDAIFCRNVVIYFNDETQKALWPRFAAALKPTGWFFLGHSERIHPKESALFQACGVTTYKRSLAAAPAGGPFEGI